MEPELIQMKSFNGTKKKLHNMLLRKYETVDLSALTHYIIILDTSNCFK